MLKSVNAFSVFDFYDNSPEKSVVKIPFFKDGKIFKSDVSCFLSLKKAGSMRFRWNEANPVRTDFLSEICGKNKSVAQIQLIHSKKVICVSKENLPAYDTCCDGIITKSRDVVPVVTAADCMPVYLLDSVTGAFGVCHSGWRGTGIALEAVSLAEKEFGSKKEDILVILGPHIHSCCYTVDKERAAYFRETFTPACITEASCRGEKSAVADAPETYHLSLAAANAELLVHAGIKPGNILHCTDCTSCTQKNGIFPFGSFRRETSGLNASSEELSRSFTPMAAYMSF